MAESEDGAGVQPTQALSQPAQAGAIPTANAAQPLPDGFNPAWPMMDAAALRAHFDDGVAAADKPPLTWANPLTQDEWDAKTAQWQSEAAEVVAAAMSMMDEGQWPTIDDCVPPGSLLALIDETFLATTDIPRELPIFAALHYVSALLLQNGVVISVVGEEWRPDIWTICMAESGSGKSFASSRIGAALGGLVDLFPDSNSSAKFIEDLRDHNLGLWMRDEFAQFLKALSSDSMGETKDYLLRCYDGSTIVRSTKTETIEVHNPALTIFGSTVFETIKDYLSREMLVDGFAQRFAFVVAERDPERPLKALYRFKERSHEIEGKWEEIAKQGFHRKYSVDELGIAAFQRAFEIIVKRGDAADVNLSFLKRISHRGMKYALLYHVLLGKTSERLDAEDFAYAAKVCALNLRDVRKVLDLYAKPQPGNKLSPLDKLGAVLAHLKKLKAAHEAGGSPSTPKAAPPSELKANCRPLRDVPSEEIRRLMAEAVEQEPDLAPFAATTALASGAKPKASS